MEPELKPRKRQYLLAEDTIGHDDIDGLVEWLRGYPWLTQGALVREFEDVWAAWLGTRHALYVNSGSSANLLMYYALLASGKLKNRKVVVPAVSWATTVAPAIQFGFEPIMCEVEIETFGLCPRHLKQICEEHDPGAVILVHVLGVPCDMDAILGLQEEHGFYLMEDACAATGSTYDGVKVGNFGDLSSFSFFFGHHLSTIEGGMVCTNHVEMQHLLLQLRSHGWAKDVPSEVEAQQWAAYSFDEYNRPFTFYHPGFNLRATDLQAKIGLSQMKKVDEVVRRRVENYRVYREMLEGHGFALQRNDRAATCPIGCAVLARDAEHRMRVSDRLERANVEHRPLGGGNMSHQPFWRERYGAQDFSVADRIAATVLQCPTHPAHTTEEIRYICETMLSA